MFLNIDFIDFQIVFSLQIRVFNNCLNLHKY